MWLIIIAMICSAGAYMLSKYGSENEGHETLAVAGSGLLTGLAFIAIMAAAHHIN